MNVRAATQTELNQLSKLQHTRSVARNGAVTSASALADEDTSASTVTLSKPAEMFKQLKSLAQSDPEGFKQLASEISEQLGAAAENAEGAQASMLGELADKFASAAQSGDVSSLEPPQGGGGPKGPPPGGGGGPKGPPPGDAPTGEAARAADAYKKHASGDTNTVKSALDAVFDLVQQRTSATA